MLERYAWADNHGAGSIDSWTVAVVEGKSAEDVVRICGGKPDKVVGEHTFAQLYYLQGDERPDTSFTCRS